jgi:hypothetical protein
MDGEGHCRIFPKSHAKDCCKQRSLLNRVWQSNCTAKKRSGLAQNVLDHIDGNAVDPGDLSRAHAVFH